MRSSGKFCRSVANSCSGTSGLRWGKFSLTPSADRQPTGSPRDTRDTGCIVLKQSRTDWESYLE